MVDKDEIKGGARQAGGKVEEGVGKAVGNDRMAAEGRADQTEGKTQKNVGKIKDAVKDQTR